MNASTAGQVRKVLNPGTGEVVGEVRDATHASLEIALNRAIRAQKLWADFPRHRRATVMNDYVREVRTRAGEIANLLSLEQGKPLIQAEWEVEGHCRLFEGFAQRVLAMEEKATFLDVEPGLERDLQFTRHEPLGVVVGIVPFNFPVQLYAHKVAPAIATGNAFIVKPSEDTPLTSVLLADILQGAGTPEGLVQVAVGGPEVGSLLVSDPRVAAVSFTGSTATGIKVALAAAQTLKRTILEVGGNDAMIVLDDADLELVADQAVIGRTYANGQVCCATKRILVGAAVHDELLERLVARFAALRVGDQLDPETEVGPLISPVAATRLADQVRLTTSQGGRVVTGGDRDGAFYTPTIIADVTSEMDASRNLEFFGPVASVLRTSSDEEAIAIANSTQFGLSGSVFTRDMERAMTFAARMESGQVAVNNTGLYRPDTMPFGNYGAGGGREGFSTSLDEYVQIKTISLPRILPGPRA